MQMLINQRAKKVDSVFDLPVRQVKVPWENFKGIQITEVFYDIKFWGASKNDLKASTS